MANGDKLISLDGLKATYDDLKAQLIKYNSVDVLAGKLTRRTTTANGITYMWNDDGTCTVTGATEDSASVCNLAYPAIPLPDGVKAGDSCDVVYSTSDARVILSLRFIQSASDAAPTYCNVSHSGTIVVPEDAAYVWICLYVAKNTTLENAVTVSSPIALLNSRSYEKSDTVPIAKTYVDNAVTGALNRLNAVRMWNTNTYINERTGAISYSSANMSVSELISIPDGLNIHIHRAAKIGKYDANGAFIETVTPEGMDSIISSADAAFVRLQFPSVNVEVMDFLIAYRYAALEDRAALEAKLTETTNKAQYLNGAAASASTGNPLILQNCDYRVPFRAFSASGISTNENIVICKKNIFALRHANGTFTKNGVSFTFNTVNHTIRIRSTSGATTATTSGFSDFGDDFKQVNGINFLHNFKFRFPVDTQVSISDNPSEEVPFDFGVQMHVYDGTTMQYVGTGGLTFVAQGGREYILYFLVQGPHTTSGGLTYGGWTGDITYSPQVEINPYPTGYERYEGIKTKLLATGEENLFRCGGTSPGRYTSGGVKALFDSATNEIYLDANNDTENSVLIQDTSNDQTVNGVTTYYINKFVPGETPVFVRGFDNKYSGKLITQITDGTTIRSDSLGSGIFFEGEADKEYAFRLLVLPGAQINTVLKPTISTGIYAIRNYGTYAGTTVLYTDQSAQLTVSQQPISAKWNVSRNNDIVSKIELLTGGRIITPFAKLLARGPMISFIDDDTTNITYVTRYHDVFAEVQAANPTKTVLGGFAVETINLDNNAGLPELLLQYEQEGYSCLYHCYHQSGQSTNYWIESQPEYDRDLIRENFMRGLRSIREYGFSNYRQWVTPYGVNDKFIVDLAKSHGMECLLNCPSRYSQNMFVTPYGNVSRWNIPRAIFIESGTNEATLKRIIDNCILSNGWLTIVSHVNSWGSSVDLMRQRMVDLLQYCIDAGAEIVPFSVGFEEYRSVFALNDLM